MERALEAAFTGQLTAVRAVAAAIAARDDVFAVDGVDGSPLVLVFLGPSGTGKTELAKKVAGVLHGGGDAAALEAAGKLKRFAMNQFTTVAAMTNLLGADKVRGPLARFDEHPARPYSPEDTA